MSNFAILVRSVFLYLAIITVGKAVKNVFRHTGKLAHQISRKKS